MTIGDFESQDLSTRDDGLVRSVALGPDYLQSPLQPLMDNLESQTYEAFEKDPVKYKQYERAIVKALELEKKKEGVDTTVLMVSRSAIRPSSFRGS